MTFDSKPYLAPFNWNAELRLSPCENGGWLVSTRAADDLPTQFLGAFTNAEDMLEALGNALLPEGEE